MAITSIIFFGKKEKPKKPKVMQRKNIKTNRKKI